MEFADLPAEAQELVTDQQVKFRDPQWIIEAEREALVALLLALVKAGVSHRDAAEIVATEFDVRDPELVVALNATRSGAK